MNRYSRRTKKDLSGTLSGVWLAKLREELEQVEADPDALRLVAYLRLSVAKLSEEDHLAALQRQYAACQRLAKGMGGTIVAVWCDMAKSADTRKGSRPEYQAMLLSLPQYGGLVVSKFDRCARDPEDIVTLIHLYEEHPGLRFTCGQEELDLSSKEGRAKAYGYASKGLDELAVMAARQEDRHAALREQGRYVGHRPFGITGQDNDQLLKAEADWIHKAAHDVIAGKTVARVCAEWLEAGVVGVNGQPMTRQTIRDLLLSPRMVGLLVVRPKAGEDSRPLYEHYYVSQETGEKVYSQVPAILDEQTWQQVVEVLKSRGKANKGTSRKGKRAKYLCSGLCWCLECGQPMNGQWVQARNAHVYRCDKGCGTISGPGLDAHVEQLVLTLWSERAVAVVSEPEPFSQQEDLDYWTEQLEENRRAFQARQINLNEKNQNHADIMVELAPIQEAWSVWNKANVKPVTTNAVERWNAAVLPGGAPEVHKRRQMLQVELERLDISKSLVRGPQQVDAGRVTPRWRDDLGVASAQGS
jgi:DNA invertase Pin-like site-specific DNA recombinase